MTLPLKNSILSGTFSSNFVPHLLQKRALPSPGFPKDVTLASISVGDEGEVMDTLVSGKVRLWAKHCDGQRVSPHSQWNGIRVWMVGLYVRSP
jgi:hypothetical protein